VGELVGLTLGTIVGPFVGLRVGVETVAGVLVGFRVGEVGVTVGVIVGVIVGFRGPTNDVYAARTALLSKSSTYSTGAPFHDDVRDRVSDWGDLNSAYHH